jgi:hypothetical protein
MTILGHGAATHSTGLQHQHRGPTAATPWFNAAERKEKIATPTMTAKPTLVFVFIENECRVVVRSISEARSVAASVSFCLLRLGSVAADV